jgi:NAD(P)-dependent dehydrogenase (short-subunit alcohol dehydrogenase family)
MPASAPVALVTGASSGIGLATAEHLAARGWRVFGTSRVPAAARQPAGAALLALDVTDDASAAACAAAVVAQAGRIDLLVNNAGVDLMGALEECTLEEAHWIFETNYFGVVRMVNAVLPTMRAQGGGQIINISSALGRAAWPFNGHYCASKFALEGYTEALCYEMNIHNIRVSSIQPGFFATEIFARARHAGQPLPAYDGPRERALALSDAWAATAAPPDAVARMVGRIAGLRRPRLRYAVGPEAHLAPPIGQLTPLAVRFKVGRWLLGLDDPRADAARAAMGVGVLGAAGLAVRALLQRARNR